MTVTSGAPAIPSPAEMLERLLDARERLAPVVHRTPVATSRTLDERTGARVFLKCENLQRIGAFKLRGAYYAISRLAAEARRRGVVTYSSGNHAQAVALTGKLLGVPATIVMPSSAPRQKIDATRGYGAEVVFHDVHGLTREALAARLAGERGLTLVPPFDHPDIIAGQGTAAAELFDQAGELDLLLVPVGGGGLISGSAIAASRFCPSCRVVGVEPENGDDGGRSFRSGRLERVEGIDTIADGARTPSLGLITFDVIRRLVADMTSVPDRELVRAMRFVFERMKLVIEPTGALGLAALLAGKVQVEGARVGVIVSGGNVDLVQALEWFRAEPPAP
jgi:threo-3-hydroxy-L-aspartate ammonia-lyase